MSCTVYPNSSYLLSKKSPELEIESLDMDARGVGRQSGDDGMPGKVVFVEGALPGERVTYSTYRKKNNFEQAQLVAVLRESSARVQPGCEYFGVCGGCSMQHLDTHAQLAVKQRALEDNLQHLGKVRAASIYRPVQGPAWGYRYRARLSVRYVVKKSSVLIGFHERHSTFVADMLSCKVLPPALSDLLPALRALIASLSIFDRIPQIEVAIGDHTMALVLRILAPLSDADESILCAFAQRHRVQFWLQSGGPETAEPFLPVGGMDNTELTYTLPEFGVRMPFKPTDFTQVNHSINRILVRRALRLLALAPTDRVLDLFCGLGNFTLPLARQTAQVVGIEGSQTLVQRARANAHANQVTHKITFEARNLFEISAADVRVLGAFDKWLIDPPREGALAVCKALAELAASGEERILPAKIVYVSCKPATLARDAGLLVHQAGYRLSGAGVINMFPHTSHIESIALFER